MNRKTPKHTRRELTPEFLEASRKRPKKQELVPAILQMTEDVRSSILLPASRNLDQIEVEYKDTGALRMAEAKNITIKTDRECEAAMEQKLRSAYPDAIFLGEEMFGAASREDKARMLTEAIKTDKMVILVDALDGTRDFRQGGDGYAVMVAVVQNDVIKAAVVHRCTDHANPLEFGHTLTFEDTDAVRINGQTLRPLSSRAFPESDTSKMRGYGTVEFMEAMKGENDAFPDLSGKFDSLSDLWTCSKMFADIITGKHHFMMIAPPADIFDYPAGVALVRKSGGVAKFLDGTDVTFSEIAKRQDFMQPEGGKTHKGIENTIILAVSDQVFRAVQRTVLQDNPKVPHPRPNIPHPEL